MNSTELDSTCLALQLCYVQLPVMAAAGFHGSRLKPKPFGDEARGVDVSMLPVAPMAIDPSKIFIFPSSRELC